MKLSKYGLALILLFVLLFLAACGNAGESGEAPDGSPANNSSSGSETSADSGTFVTDTTSSAAPQVTLQDISAAQQGVQSYRYQQITKADGETFAIEISYRDKKMKTKSEIEGIGEAYTYFDFEAGEMISYIPSQDKTAMRMAIDSNSEDIPVNPLDIDYQNDYQITGSESIDGYDCQILSSLDGSLKVWIMPEYGFPIKIEVTEGEYGVTYITEFKDFSFNDLSEEDVTLPAGVEIVDLSGMGQKP